MSGYVTATFTAILPKRTTLIRADRMKGQLEQRMTELVDTLHDEAQTYEPPPSPNYQRTYKLKRSWGARGTVKYENGDLVGEVTSEGNVAYYNKWVKGKRVVQLARMRNRGWRSIEDIMEEEWPKAERDFKNIVASAGR